MDEFAEAFKALADPARRRILQFLSRPDAECCTHEDRVCACDLEGVLGLSQPCVSHHLKILIRAGLVSAEKSGRWVYYRVRRGHFADLSRVLGEFAGAFGSPTSPLITRIAPPARKGKEGPETTQE